MAGNPAKTIPCNTRSTIIVSKLGENASASVKIEAAKIEMVINDFLPHASDNDPTMTKLTAKAKVVTERDKLATAGDTLNTSAKVGNNGCVLYKFANVIKPAKNKAQLAL